MKYLRHVLILVMLAVIVSSQPVSALTTDDFFCIRNNSCSYKPGCDASVGASTEASDVTAGTGTPRGATFPNLDPSSMSDAIDKWVAKENPNSELKGLGSVIVASSKKSNINPFLIVAIAKKESSLADPTDFNVKGGHNAFGRTATSSQPNFNGAHLWYKWNSAKASVDASAAENQSADGGGDMATYLQMQYKDKIASSDLTSLFMEYAPPGDHNDTKAYISDVKSWIDDLVSLSSSGSGIADTKNAPAASAACCEASTTSVALSGNTPAAKAFSFLVGQGLSTKVAAGVVGNMMTEAGGNTEKLDTHAHNDISGTHDGIVQWSTGRWASLKNHEQGKDPFELATQLDYVMFELNGQYKSTVLEPMKGAGSASEAATIFNKKFEISGDESQHRENNAQKIFTDYGGGASETTAANATTSEPSPSCSDASAEASDAVGDANMMKTVTVSTPGKFIVLPKKYSCPGHTTSIDSRIAADIAYLVEKYKMCADDGVSGSHRSHGAGLGIDMRPSSGNSKDDWKNTVEAAARDLGWFGDGASDSKGSKPGCAHYAPGDYGSCMHSSYPKKIPTWARWIGYNGDVAHGDPWHVYGGSYGHIHIGWDTPNHDGASAEISAPRESVYAFPAPIPDDLKGLIN